MKKKVKAVIKEETQGVKYDVYKKFLWFWVWDFGYKPLTTAFFLIEENLSRLKTLYGDSLVIDDRRIKKVV